MTLTADGQSSIYLSTIADPAYSDLSDPVTFFDLNSVAFQIVDLLGKYEFSVRPRIALQFPDCLLAYAVDILEFLESQVCNLMKSKENLFYVLADTQSSPCCCDTIAARHVDAEILVAFGRSCSNSQIIAGIHIIRAYGKMDLNLCSFYNSLPLNQKILVIYDVVHSHVKWTRNEFEYQSAANEFQSAANDLNYPTVCFVGPESGLVAHLAMQFCASNFYHFDSSTNELKKPSPTHLAKRLRLIHQAKDAKVVGILISAFSSENYLALVQSIKNALTKSGKKYYTFALSKLNIAKLANFLEIKVYVLVSCPQSSVIDSSEYFAPIVTPFELAVALEMSDQFGQEYQLSFEKLADRFNNLTRKNTDPYISFITGKLETGRWFENDTEKLPPYLELNDLDKHAKPQLDQLEKTQLDLQTEFTIQSAAASFLHQSRSWKGLDPEIDESLDLKAEQGRFGTASRYNDELE